MKKNNLKVWYLEEEYYPIYDLNIDEDGTEAIIPKNLYDEYVKNNKEFFEIQKKIMKILDIEL